MATQNSRQPKARKAPYSGNSPKSAVAMGARKPLANSRKLGSMKRGGKSC